MGGGEDRRLLSKPETFSIIAVWLQTRCVALGKSHHFSGLSRAYVEEVGVDSDSLSALPV